MKEKLKSLHNLAGKEFEILVVEFLIELYERQEIMSAQLDQLTATNADTIAKLGVVQTQVAAIQASIQPVEDLTAANAQATQINTAVAALVSQTAPAAAPPAAPPAQ